MQESVEVPILTTQVGVTLSFLPPAGHCSKSGRKQHASSTFSYLSLSRGEPNKIFSRTVVLEMNGV